MLTKSDSNHAGLPPDLLPTFQISTLKPASTTPGKQGKNRESSWLENGHDYWAAFCVTEILSFTCHLCGFIFSFCITYCVDFDWVNFLHSGWYGVMLWSSAGKNVENLFNPCWAALIESQSRPFLLSTPSHHQVGWGCIRNWEEKQPGQLTSSDQRHIPDLITLCLVYKPGQRAKKWGGDIWGDGVYLPKSPLPRMRPSLRGGGWTLARPWEAVN